MVPIFFFASLALLLLGISGAFANLIVTVLRKGPTKGTMVLHGLCCLLCAFGSIGMAGFGIAWVIQVAQQL